MTTNMTSSCGRERRSVEGWAVTPGTRHASREAPPADDLHDVTGDLGRVKIFHDILIALIGIVLPPPRQGSRQPRKGD
jgi:hypothetical protein